MRALVVTAPGKGGSAAVTELPDPARSPMRWSCASRPAGCAAPVCTSSAVRSSPTSASACFNMLMTLPAMRLIDRRGRKPLLRWGALGMCAAMVLLAVTNLSGLGYGVLLSVLTLGGIALCIASFAISWGPVQWVMLPELFPMRIRASAVGLCVLFNWLFNMIVALVFPSLLHAWGAGINFLFFAGTTLLAFLFVQRLLPETKGRSLEEIEQDLLRGRPARPEADGSVPVSSGAAHP